MFIGLMSFWCLFHFDQRRYVHFALIVFTALFAAIHWAEYLEAQRTLTSPLVNTVPLLAFVATAPFRPSSGEPANRPKRA